MEESAPEDVLGKNSAFLSGEITENVYVEVPKEF